MGAFEAARGKIKTIGSVTDNDELEEEGEAQEEKGEAQRESDQAHVGAKGHDAKAKVKEARQTWPTPGRW